MSLLEQNTIKKEQIDEKDVAELDTGNNKSGEYKMGAICNSAVYARESNQDIYQGSTIWFFEKAIQKKKILSSLT